MADQIALVTGAGSGIGRAVAMALLGAGWRVALVGRRAEALAETAELSGKAGNALIAPADVADETAVQAAFAAAQARFGRLDLLFNNAGAFAPATPFEDVTAEDWTRMVAVNLTGAFFCAREAFRRMKAQNPQGGRIINNGSISAQVPRPHSAAYTATKHALTGLTKSLALDGRDFNIAAGQIDIGNAATNMTAGFAQGALQPDGNRKVEPQFAVAHVADAVLYMAGLPLNANVPFLTVMATGMPFMGRG